MGDQIVTSEISKQFHARFVKIKALGTYVLISRDSIGGLHNADMLVGKTKENLLT